MTAMEYAEKLIADKERDKTVFDNSQRNLIVNFAYKLDDRAATEELANNLAAAVAAENTEEINRLMWEAEEKIESLPDGMIGLSEMYSIFFFSAIGLLPPSTPLSTHLTLECFFQFSFNSKQAHGGSLNGNPP